MIALQNRDGTTINLNMDEDHAELLRPALASGWAIGKMIVPIDPVFVPIGTALVPVTAPAKERKARVAKEPPLPSEEAIKNVRNVFEVRRIEGATKRWVKDVLTTMGSDTVDGCIDWLAHRGDLVLTGKTYRLAPVATQGGEK